MKGGKKGLRIFLVIMPLVLTIPCSMLVFIAGMSNYGWETNTTARIAMLAASIVYIASWLPLLIYGTKVSSIRMIRFFLIWWIISFGANLLVGIVKMASYGTSLFSLTIYRILNGISNLFVWIFSMPLGGLLDFIPGNFVSSLMIIPPLIMAIIGFFALLNLKKKQVDIEQKPPSN